MREDLRLLVIHSDEPMRFVCMNCRLPVVMVADPTSGVVDWGAEIIEGVALRFDCEVSPARRGSHWARLNRPDFTAHRRALKDTYRRTVDISQHS